MSDDTSPGHDPERTSKPPDSAVPHGRPDLLPIIVLAVIAALCLAGWWLFPALQGLVSHQDCIATGRTAC